MILHNILQGGDDEFVEEEISVVIADGYRFGDHQFTKPNILWQNNKTFLSGDKSNVGFENQMRIIEYNHLNSSFYETPVGNGAGYFDQYSHPLPYLWIEFSTGFIYLGQSTPHNVDLSLWKSNVSNTVKNGFTQLDDITGAIAYPQFFRDINGNVSICTRHYTPFDSISFDFAVKVGDGSIEGTYTDVVISNVNTTGLRIYNAMATPYGINTKQYVAGARRSNNSVIDPSPYFAYLVTVTEDFATFYNPTNTTSKNVASVSGLTDAEIDADYTINGSLADEDQDLGMMNCISVNNVFYGIGRKAGTNAMTIWKIDNDVVTEHTVGVTNIYGGFFNPFLYWNGVNLVISCITWDGITARKEIWSTPMDLSSYSQKYALDTTTEEKPILLPDNLDMVTGEYLMFLYNDTTNSYFFKTTDKFFI